jgi:membrane protease YdiL (CAAX protease family)
MAAIGAYLLLVFAGAALIAPRMYETVQFLAENNTHFWRLAHQPFDRYVGRCLLLLALVGLPSFFKALGVRSAAALGLRNGWRHWAETAQGFAWGFAALAIAAAMSVAFGARVLDLHHSSTEWMKQLRGAAITAVIVAIIEEVLFRGALFGTLRREKRFWTAALLSSAIYALLHFFEKPPEPHMIEWNSGFIVLGQMFRGFAKWEALMPGFFNLLLVGLLLCLAFERTGSLLFSVGLHAGFVFWVKSYGLVTNDVPGGNEWLWGSSKLVDGWVAGLLLLGMYLVFVKILPGKNRENLRP